MRGIAAALLVLLAIAGPASALPATSPVVLIHHALDQVDPFGVPFGSGDTFSARYADIAAQTGRFDFPVFVADGVVAIQQLPDPTRPFEGTLQAYRSAVAERANLEVPTRLGLLATEEAGQARVNVRSDALGNLGSDAQPVHLFLAVVEDAIHYQPPAPVSNGVTEHRFTVRWLVDAGPVALADWNRTANLPLDAGWQRDRLSIAAWLQAGPVAGRFAPREVLQAVAAPLDGVERFQTGKGVLVEAYSATWCDECLYGDLALEQLAIEAGAAQPLEPVAATYWQSPQQPFVVAGAALAAFLVAVALARRRA